MGKEKNTPINFALFSLSVLICAPLWASRVVSSYPITATSNSGTVPSSAADGFAQIYFKNLTPRPQTVTVKIESENLSVDVFIENPAAMTGWVANPNGTNFWYQKYSDINRPSAESGGTVPANGDLAVGFKILMNFDTSLPSNPFLFSGFPVGPGFNNGLVPGCTSSCFKSAVVAYRATIKITVNEDLGALLAGLRLYADLFGDPTQKRESINLAINGGRPF